MEDKEKKQKRAIQVIDPHPKDSQKLIESILSQAKAKGRSLGFVEINPFKGVSPEMGAAILANVKFKMILKEKNQ